MYNISKLSRRDQMPRQPLRIAPDEAKSRVEAGKAVILDVVAPDSWKNMRLQIAGAVRIEPEDFAKYYKVLLPQDKQVIAYCT
jgi:rhodanese-related sulfurtransferase